MSFETRTCVVLMREGPAACDPWDEGAYHFDTEAEAIKVASAHGWTFRDGRALCVTCTADDDCARRGHDWGGWVPKEQFGIPYRFRRCGHCAAPGYDPTFDDLTRRFRVVAEAESVVRAVAP